MLLYRLCAIICDLFTFNTRIVRTPKVTDASQLCIR